MLDNGSLKSSTTLTMFLLGLLCSNKVFNENKDLPRIVEIKEDIDYAYRHEEEKSCKKTRAHVCNQMIILIFINRVRL